VAVSTLLHLLITTPFGWYASFLFLRTGSLWLVILVHSFCNWMGPPRVWGRIRAYPVGRGGDHGQADWSIAYYSLLVAGAVGFYLLLWPLTESRNALARF
jgi:prenyl protein peptidase